jgi:hypothetical protein
MCTHKGAARCLTHEVINSKSTFDVLTQFLLILTELRALLKSLNILGPTCHFYFNTPHVQKRNQCLISPLAPAYWWFLARITLRS